MSKKFGWSLVLVAALVSVSVMAAENPVTAYGYGKLLPFAQSVATLAAVLYLVIGGMKFIKSDDPAEKDKGIKVVIGVAIAIALIWLAPQIIDYLKPS